MMSSLPIQGTSSALSSTAFREIVEQSLTGTLLVEDEKIVYANARCAHIFGRSVEELIGLQLDQVVHPDDRRAGNERMPRMAGKALGAPYSIRALRPDGSIRELETLTGLSTIEGRQFVMISIIDVSERNRTQRILNQIAEAAGSKIGAEFFSSLVLNLARSLSVDYAFVAELCDDQKHLRMIAAAVDGALAAPVTYAIAGTPCEMIMTASPCWYPSNVQQLFPGDQALVEMGVQSYAGVPLKDRKGRAIGLLSIMNRAELPHEYSAEAALEVYAVRAAAELERKIAESALLTATAYLDNLIETASVMIVEIDIQGCLTRLNRMAEEITGYRRDELLGRNWFELMMPPHRIASAALYLQNLRQGKLQQVNESPIRTRDGSERAISWRNSEIRNGEGAIVGSLSFGVDVTERIRVQAERARLQDALSVVDDEWRRTFDAVNTPILITQRDGVVIRVNQAARALSGLDEDQIVGKDIAAVRPDEPWQTAAQMVRYISDEHTGTSAETRDRHGRTWDITIDHFSAEKDHSERYILVLWNITGIVELQESLRRSETMSAMGTIVAGVAHEVRNPLFGLSATLDAFADELSQPGYKECAAALRAEVNRLAQLMQELLEYGKPSALNVERGSLDAVIREAIDHRAPSEVVIENAVAADLPALLMDRGRLRQVFENVINNAAQFAPQKSTVRVAAAVVERAGRRHIECRVEDDGPGFQPEDLDRVFEPFFTRRQEGTGLGLSIVQRIVQDHGGRVFAENRPGGGACLRILLPVAAEQTGSGK